MAVSLFAKAPQKALEALVRDLSSRKAALDAHHRNTPSPVDLDAVAQHRIDGERLAALVSDAERAVEFQKQAVERAEAQAREADLDAAHADAQKAAAQAKRLTLSIFKDAETLAEKLSQLETLRGVVDHANSRRGNRPFIIDGERMARETQATAIPASYREETIWVDNHGRQPSEVRFLSDGKAVDNAGTPLTKKNVRVEQTAKRIHPAQMPERLADAVALPSIHGRAPLWPRR